MVRRPEDMVHKKKWKQLCLFSLEKRRLRRKFVALYNYLIREYRDGANHFLEVHRVIMRL